RRPPVARVCPYTTLFRSGQPLGQFTLPFQDDAAQRIEILRGLHFCGGVGHGVPLGIFPIIPKPLARSSISGESVPRKERQYMRRSEEHTSELQSRENLVC